MFESEDQDFELDLEHYHDPDGEPLKGGVYVYHIGALMKGAQESIDYTGTITILR